MYQADSNRVLFRDNTEMRKTVSWLLIGLCTVVAAGGYFQVLASSVFWCGRVEAFPGTTLLALICIGQTGLYLAASASPTWARPYRLSQIVVLPFLLVGLLQVFSPHPRTVIFLALLAAIPATLSRTRVGWQWTRPHIVPISALFVVSALGFLAALGQLPLTLRGVTAPTWLIGPAAILAAAVSIPVIASIRAEVAAYHLLVPCLSRYLPLALLLFPVLRAKLPDVAYDSYMYKTTLPYQIAEWRTGDTAIVDGFMVGTNLQEILNALLVIITRDYLPPLVSTLSFVLLLGISPLAFPVERRETVAGRAVVAFAGISAFVLSEAGIGQGTAYQEPLLLLFLVASLIRCPAWPAFLAIAIAVKVNAVFIAPLIVLSHLFGYRQFWLSPRRLAVAVLAGAIVLLPQFHRNVVFSGRLLGLSETLASVTDPPGPGQIMLQGDNRYDADVRGGTASNAALSACNMFGLETICPTLHRNSDDAAGFHVFPASRAPLFAALFAAAIILESSLRRSRRLVALSSGALFLVCYIALLNFLSEGRYFLPLSFGFSLLLLMNPRQAEDIVRALGTSRRGRLLAVGLGCWLVGSDLIPGTFANVSWTCRRDLLTTAQILDLRQPETPLQSFLVSYVDRYKRVCPPPGLPPVILAEPDTMNSPYLGAQRIFHLYTQRMIARFFAADPTRRLRAADAIIAVVSRSPDYDTAILGPAEADYTPCFHDDRLHVICSARLAPRGDHCAESLYRPN
jgi:hypothetical protein